MLAMVARWGGMIDCASWLVVISTVAVARNGAGDRLPGDVGGTQHARLGKRVLSTRSQDLEKTRENQ